jgi:hypothetical protein
MREILRACAFAAMLPLLFAQVQAQDTQPNSAESKKAVFPAGVKVTVLGVRRVKERWEDKKLGVGLAAKEGAEIIVVRISIRFARKGPHELTGFEGIKLEDAEGNKYDCGLSSFFTSGASVQELPFAVPQNTRVKALHLADRSFVLRLAGARKAQ